MSFKNNYIIVAVHEKSVEDRPKYRNPKNQSKNIRKAIEKTREKMS